MANDVHHWWLASGVRLEPKRNPAVHCTRHVSSPIHRLSNQRIIKTTATTSASIRMSVSTTPATKEGGRCPVQRIRTSSLYRAEINHRQPRTKAESNVQSSPMNSNGLKAWE